MATVHRVVTDPYPGLSALAELVDPAHPEDLEELIALKNETDDVVRSTTVAAVATVAPAERYVGNHAEVVMAPFMWFSPSRFSPGTFGVLYTAVERLTAVRESAFHAERLLRAAENMPPDRIPRIALTLQSELEHHDDVRRATTPQVDRALYDRRNYAVAQAFGSRVRAAGGDGIRYDSVRSPGGGCVATFRPAAVRCVNDDAVQVALLWDGKRITSFEEIRTVALGSPVAE